jgi:hypothetical protein
VTLVDYPTAAGVETLGGITTELESLNRDTEQEFLKIGSKVAEFIDTVNLMSSDLSLLAELASGEQGQRASDALNGVLDVSTGMQGRGQEGSRLLGTMSRQATRLKQTLSQFSGTVATFHSLGLLTRIETARLGNAGADFGNLAEEVRLLARNVQSRVESVLDTAGELIPRIECALQEAAVLQEGQAKNLPLLISQVSENLSSFREMQREAREASVRLGTQYGEIAEAFKRLIVSLQFNDITRQQVEHVIEVLRRLNSETAAEDGALLIQRHGAASVLELQSAQLANAANKFSASVASVAKNLDQIAANSVKMVGESSVLSGLSGKNSFFRQMERGCAAILSALTQCAGADEATGATSDGLAEKIGLMRASVEEIRTIETQMRRIAMNARISAEHLGPSGKALSALADSIKQRAFESRQGSDSLMETLQLMSELVTQLSAHAHPEGAESETRDLCFEGMRSAVDDLRASQETSAIQITQITSRGDGICEDLAGTRNSFSIGVRFTDAVDRTRGRLGVIADEVRARFAGDGNNNKADALGLAQLAAHYTMQEERDILVGVDRLVPLTAKRSEALEENIEFF